MKRVFGSTAICWITLVIALMTSPREATAQTDFFPPHPGSLTVFNPYVMSHDATSGMQRLPSTTSYGVFMRLPVVGWPSDAEMELAKPIVTNWPPMSAMEILPTWRNVAVPYVPASVIVQEQLPPVAPAQPQAIPLQPPAPSRTPPPRSQDPIQPAPTQPTPRQPAPTETQPSEQERPDGPIGEAPEEEDVTTQFLRQSTLVLAPGSLQVDVGLAYAWQQTDLITVLPPGVPVFERVRNRNFVVPFNVRYGLAPRVEVFAGMPLGLGILERSNPAAEDITARGPQGDLSFGGVFEIARARDNMPDITATFTATAPTGGDPTFGRNVATLGSGFWSISGGLNFVKTYDPIALFGSFGLRHDFQEDVLGTISFQPGETFFYSYGAAFGVNNDISLTASFNGSYTGKSRLDGVAIPDSSAESMALRFGLVKRIKSDLRMQPFVSFGITPDAPDASFGVVFTRDVEASHHQGLYK